MLMRIVAPKDAKNMRIVTISSPIFYLLSSIFRILLQYAHPPFSIYGLMKVIESPGFHIITELELYPVQGE